MDDDSPDPLPKEHNPQEIGMDDPDEVQLARYLSGESSQVEKQQVEHWIRADPDRQREVENLARIWQMPEAETPAVDIDRMWRETVARAPLSSPRAVVNNRAARWQWLRYAAVLIAAIGLTYLVSDGLGDPSGSTAALKATMVSSGKRTRITLSDGTIVVLDAGSSLTYPERFDGATRDVSLHGEGYFEVTSEAKRPFIVRARTARIQVLGTRFNVRSWGRNRQVEVAVVEGSVGVGSVAAGSQQVVLNAGLASVVPDDGVPTPARPVDVDAYLDWMRDELVFVDRPLGEVIDRLERWHGVRFQVADPDLVRERVTVHLPERDLTKAMSVIAGLTGRRCYREGGVVYVAGGE